MDWFGFKLIPSSLFTYDAGFNTKEFLASRNSFLLEYQYDNPSYQLVRFPEHLDALCKASNVPQKWVLVSLQREQSLVTENIIPVRAWRLNACMGYGVLDDHNGVVDAAEGATGMQKKYYGFFNQLSWAVPRCRVLFDRWTAETSQVVENKMVQTPDAFTFLQLKYTPVMDVLNTNYSIWKRFWEKDLA